MKLNESVSRAIDIVKLIALTREPLTLTEISKRQGIPKTSAFGIVSTLVARKVLEIDDENAKTFRLGLGLFETTLTALSGTDLSKAARPALEDLNRRTGETVLFAVEDDGDMVFLDRVEGDSYIRATIKLGTRVHMHCSAIGKAVLAALPEADLFAFLRVGKLERATEHTIVNRAELLKNFAAIRARGYSIDDQENIVDVICVGAPIYSRSRKVVAGISITMQASRATDEKLGHYGMLVHEFALKISRRIGFAESDLYWDHQNLLDASDVRATPGVAGATVGAHGSMIHR